MEHNEGLLHDAALVRLILATLIALLGAGIGVAFAGARRRLGPLVGVAGGAMLAVTLFSLLPEAASSGPLRPGELLLSVASGYVVFYLIGRYVYPVCPACASTAAHHEHEHDSGECAVDSDHECGCGDDHGHGEAVPVPSAEGSSNLLRNTSLLLTLVLTLHSMLDGLAVVHGTLGHHAHTGHMAQGGTTSAALGMLLAVSLHKLPEGLALSALLLSAGSRPWRAFLLTAAVEGTTLLGGLFGARLLGDAPPQYIGMTLAHIGGSFLYLVFHGFFGGLFNSGPRNTLIRRFGPQVVYGAVGFVAVAALLWGLGGAHAHS